MTGAFKPSACPAGKPEICWPIMGSGTRRSLEVSTPCPEGNKKAKNDPEPRKVRPKTFQKEKLRLKAVENEISALEDALAALETAFIVEASDYQRLGALTLEEKSLREQHHVLIEEWVTLTGEIEGE
ncbi:MAG: ABC transporter C-terminal domain-containing protein [Erysipelotrichaceae bacterium]|nr:ABC transporter C-terminal domain-containing protein [Erysipelotrichaceae bacterium]